MSSPYDKLLQDYRRQTQRDVFTGTLLALDPGETTGWAIFDCTSDTTKLRNHGQAPCYPIETGVLSIQRLCELAKPDFMVWERYVVYNWKSASHSWSKLHTSQLIGAIETYRLMHKIPKADQSAQEAKQFVTDEKLHDWGFYIKGKKHTRDAIRHGLYWLMFHK